MTTACCEIPRLLKWMYYVPKTQDESNVRGGKWIVRLRKNLVSRYWENLVCGRRDRLRKHISVLRSPGTTRKACRCRDLRRAS
jgi:hypothetical protein